jgi:hypothetical protein
MGWDSKHLVYGEYFVNPTRLPVRIWASEDIGETWRPVHTFDDVRHVHSCQFDSFSDCFWVASGDLDHESHLRITSDLFSTICTVAGGDQRFRAIAFVFEKDHVLFGTDTPLARNCIMRMDRQTRSIQPILEVGGSVFYLDKCPQGLVCSTSVEPSTVNPSRQCEVWYSSDGNRWSRIAGFEKDNWSMHYFQFGRVHIPDGSGSTEGLWVSPIGTKGDGHSLLLGLPGQS